VGLDGRNGSPGLSASAGDVLWALLRVFFFFPLLAKSHRPFGRIDFWTATCALIMVYCAMARGCTCQFFYIIRCQGGPDRIFAVQNGFCRRDAFARGGAFVFFVRSRNSPPIPTLFTKRPMVEALPRSWNQLQRPSFSSRFPLSICNPAARFGNPRDRRYFLFSPWSIIWVGDTAGYFVGGRSIGKHAFWRRHSEP